jgi:hypothetical protein
VKTDDPDGNGKPRQTPTAALLSGEFRKAGEDGRCAAENRGRGLSRRSVAKTETPEAADGFLPRVIYGVATIRCGDYDNYFI